MPNSIAVSITADVADLQVKRAILSQELKTAQKDLADFAKAAKGGQTDELRTSMLASADAVTKFKNQIGNIDGQMRKAAASTALVTEATVAETVATEASTVAHGSSRASFEALVLVHEAMRGNFSRMAGSALIEAQALAGAERSAAALRAVMSPLGLIVGVSAAAMVVAAVATAKYDAAQSELMATTLGLGAVSGLTAKQLQDAGETASEESGRTIASTTASAEAFAAAGIKSGSVITTLSGDVEVFAALTGQKAAEAQKQLAEAMADPAKGAEDLNGKLSILDQTALEHIKTLADMGEKDKAVAELTAALHDRVDQARQAGVGMTSEMGALANVFSFLGGEIAKANHQLDIFSAFGFASGGVEQGLRAKAEAASQNAAHMAQLNNVSAAGASVFAGTPEGQDASKYQDLVSNLAKAKAALQADTELRGANSEAAKRDAEAVADYGRAVSTYIPTAQKAHEIATLDAQIAQAQHSHNKSLIADLTQKKSLIEQAGVAESDAAAKQKAADAANVAQSKSGAGKKGPDVVQEWAEQLHAEEIQSNNFFADQTARELAFWQAKVGAVQKGSKQWLEVQGHIYDAQKTLAREAYNEHLADLNDQIQADKDNWSKEQGVWQEKLAYIASKFGQTSKEYKDAHRELEAAEREHEVQMLQAARDAGQTALSELRARLDSARTIREQDARQAQAEIEQQSKYSANPFSAVSAAVQSAAINKAAIAQQLADETAAHVAEDRMADEYLAKVRETVGVEGQIYTKAYQAKIQMDQAWSQRHGVLLNQMANADRAAALKVQQAWHSAIDPLVATTGNEIKGLIEGTETWGEALRNIGESIVGVLEQALVRMVANWIVNMITGQAAATTSNVGTAQSYVGVAYAAGVASMAGAPFPVNATAPAFGSAMAAAAEIGVTMASLAVGTNSVPSDMIAQIHAGERIIPAADNRALMSAVSGGGAGVGVTQEVHHHHHYEIRALDGADVQRVLERNHSSHAAAMESLVRRRNGRGFGG